MTATVLTPTTRIPLAARDEPDLDAWRDYLSEV